MIIKESERLGRLIANVLDFSRIERGERRYDLGPEELEEMTREAMETFRRLGEGEGVEISMAGEPPSLAPVIADREATVQAILNLLSNAAKYSPDGSPILVELVSRQEEAGILVRDQGIGLPAPEQRRIFDDFYRAPGARAAGVEGTGIGLALVRRHMEACGGRATVKSSLGEGSCFGLWFPAAPAGERRKGAAT